jgi:hypothetical protein
VSLEGVTYDNGVRKKYVSVGNLLFRDPEGHTLAFVRDSAGQVAVMIADGVAEFEAQRGAMNGHTQVVLLLVAVLILVLSAVMWPIGAVARWRYRRPLREQLDAASRKRLWIVRATILSALIMITLAAVYLAALARLDLEVLSASTDPYIRVFQLLAVLVLLGSVHAVWSAVTGWKRREGSLYHRLESTATGLALTVLAVFIASYHMLTIRLDY